MTQGCHRPTTTPKVVYGKKQLRTKPATPTSTIT